MGAGWIAMVEFCSETADFSGTVGTTSSSDICQHIWSCIFTNEQIMASACVVDSIPWNGDERKHEQKVRRNLSARCKQGQTAGIFLRFPHSSE